jgi:hypothetical protein
VQRLASSVTLGATSIPCRTDGFEFVAGGRAILWRSVNSFEVVDIDSVDADALQLTAPLVQSWAAATLLYPVRDARILADSEESAWNDTTGSRRVTFTIDEPCDWPAVLPATTYRSYPVLEHRSDENDDPTAAYHRELEDVDADTGPVTYVDYVDAPIRVASHRWLLQGRAAHGDFRSLLYGLRGRVGVLWLPSMSADLVLVAPMTSGAVTMTVEWCGYTLYGRQQSNRRDIRIELRDGTVLYRRITGSVEDTGTEVLTIASAPGRAIAPSQVRLISFMTLSELTSDAVEINHVTDADGITKAALAFQGLKHAL